VILRGAAMSEKRLSLDVRPPESPPVATKPTAGPAAPPPRPLTLDIVLRWLEERDGVTRSRVAEALAEDIESVRATAREEGTAAGTAAGLAAAERRTQSAIAALEKMAQEAETAFQAELTTLSEACADVVCAALAKIAGPLLETREAALGAVLEVLNRVKDDREIRILVGVADLEALQAAEEQIAAAFGTRSFSLIADPRVKSGGCIVETSLGTLDGRFEIQWSALWDVLKAGKA
jgi:flagellar assembly protein FliH